MHRPLRERDLLPHGPLRRLGCRVLLFPEVESTNSHLLARAAKLPDGTLAFAEFQTAGRGRHARRWHSPRGASVLLSVLLHEPAASPWIAAAGLAAAVACCEAIERTTDCRPAVRWPNDVTIDGRKVAGVLVETATHEQSPARAVVIGIGLNCLQHRGHFDDELAQRATSLEIESSHAVDRAAVAAALVERLDALLTAAPSRPKSKGNTDVPPVSPEGIVRARWLERCHDRGTAVTLVSDGRTYRGVVADVLADGNLLVQLEDGRRTRFGAATTTRLW